MIYEFASDAMEAIVKAIKKAEELTDLSGDCLTFDVRVEVKSMVANEDIVGYISYSEGGFMAFAVEEVVS